jgi:hypothetical protein
LDLGGNFTLTARLGARACVDHQWPMVVGGGADLGQVALVERCTTVLLAAAFGLLVIWRRAG